MNAFKGDKHNFSKYQAILLHTLNIICYWNQRIHDISNVQCTIVFLWESVSIFVKKNYSQSLFCLIMLHPEIFSNLPSSRQSTEDSNVDLFSPLGTIRRYVYDVYWWLYVWDADRQATRVVNSKPAYILSSNGVWKYGHTNETKRMCHRWKNKTWSKWLRARPFVVYDAIVQRYVHCN